MLALRLLPSGDGWQSPHISHLLALVERFHQLVVEVMGLLETFSCPDDKLGAVGEVTARDVGRWVGLSPCDYVEYLEAQLRELVGYGENIVIGARNPDGPILPCPRTPPCRSATRCRRWRGSKEGRQKSCQT